MLVKWTQVQYLYWRPLFPYFILLSICYKLCHRHSRILMYGNNSTHINVIKCNEFVSIKMYNATFNTITDIEYKTKWFCIYICKYIFDIVPLFCFSMFILTDITVLKMWLPLLRLLLWWFSSEALSISPRVLISEVSFVGKSMSYIMNLNNLQWV